MLRGIHNASKNWLGRVIMGLVLGLIVVSFAIWGVADMFRGFGQSTVAKIGGTEIGIEQFRQLFNDRVQQLGQQMKRPLTPEQARTLGIDRQLLGELVAQAALDTRVHELGLGLRDADVAARITADPTFAGLDGKFDHNRFVEMIRRAGYTEQRFVDEQRRVMLRQQVAETLAGGMSVPKAEIDVFQRYRGEERSIDYLALGEAQAGTIEPPSPETLAKYFEDHKALFRAPEYRKVDVLSVLPQDLATWTEISDADAKAVFEREQARFSTPEKRQLQQITFPDLAAAQTAADRIKQGTAFAAVATERGLKDSDIDLGTLTKQGMVDDKVADAAFALKEGETSAPVQGRFGIVLVHVVKVEAATQRSYEQVAPELKKQIALERAKSQAQSLYNKVEDERSNGLALAAVAKKLNLPIKTIEVDRSGRGPDGQPVDGLPKGVDLIDAAFASDVGIDNDALQANGSYVWYDVVAITPSRDRPITEVKDQVEKSWRAAEIDNRLTKLADDLLAKLKNGTPIAELAGNGLTVQSAAGLKRAANDAPVPKATLTAVFRTPKGSAGATPGGAPDTRIVFVVKDVTEPKTDAAAFEIKQLTDRLRQSLSEDLLSEYVAQVESEIGSSVNQAALAQATGASSSAN